MVNLPPVVVLPSQLTTTRVHHCSYKVGGDSDMPGHASHSALSKNQLDVSSVSMFTGEECPNKLFSLVESQAENGESVESASDLAAFEDHCSLDSQEVCTYAAQNISCMCSKHQQ